MCMVKKGFVTTLALVNKYLSNETELTDLAKLYDSRGS